MKRYIDFRADDWVDRTDSRMQSARWAACMEGLDLTPPFAGVIDTYDEDLLEELQREGWLGPLPEEGDLRTRLRDAVMDTLASDVDCLSIEEHTLIERLLIGEGRLILDSVAEAEAAYTLRMRMWCDVGIDGQDAVLRLDPQLAEVLPVLLMRPEHTERRSRIFVFDGMLHGLLYINGLLDATLPGAQFIQEVLNMEETAATHRLARNYLEASFDTYAFGSRTLLVHEALADPEALLASQPSDVPLPVPEITASAMAASMNGLLPEEIIPDEKLQRALYGALRPEYEPSDAVSDLRYLAKQDAPIETLQEIMASMLYVLPTQHMDSALRELRTHTPRWGHQEATGRPHGVLH